MSRGLLRNDVTDAEGNAVQGALVTVYVAGTLTKATLYSESVGGVIIANPLTTDVKGVFQSFVETGEYDLAVVTAAGTENVYNIPVLDADDVASIEANLATSQQQIDDLQDIFDGLTADSFTDTSRNQTVQSTIDPIVRNFATVAAAKAASYKVGDVVTIEERGGARFKASATGSGDGFSSLLRDDGGYLELDEQGAVDIKALGAKFDGSDQSGVFAAALLSSFRDIIISGQLTLQSPVSETITTGKCIKGDGKLLWDSASVTDGYVVRIDANGNDVQFLLELDGGDKIHSGLRIDNTTSMAGSLPTVKLGERSNFKNFYRASSGTSGNYCAVVSGSYELVEVVNSRFGRVGRASGTGTPGSSGTNSLAIVSSGVDYWAKKIIHRGCTYEGMYSDEVGAADVDCDYFGVFLPDPTNFPNDEGSFNEYPPVSVESSGCTYINPIGRCEKFQCVPNSHDHVVIYEGGRTIAGGMANLFNAQWGVGSISDIHIQLNAASGVSPVSNGLVPISFFNGTDYGVVKTGITCKNVIIENNIPSLLDNNLDHLIDLRVSTGLYDEPIGNVVIDNITLSGGSATHVIAANFDQAEGAVSLSNVYLSGLIHSVVGAGDGNSNLEFSFFNVRNFGAAKPLFSDFGGGIRNHFGLARGYGLTGVDVGSTVFRSGPNNGGRPLLYEGALAGSGGSLAGAITADGATLSDDEAVTFAVKGYTQGQHLFALSASSGVGALFFSSGPSGSITQLTTAYASNFEIGVGSNPDVDLKINLWVDANGALNIKNRLGSTRAFTVAYIG